MRIVTTGLIAAIVWTSVTAGNSDPSSSSSRPICATSTPGISDWPMYSHDSKHSFSCPVTAHPELYGPPLQVTFQSKLGRISAYGDRLMVGSESGHLIGFDREGQIHWSTDLGEPISQTPALTSELIVIATRKGTLYFVDNSGVVLSSSVTGSTSQLLSPMISSEGICIADMSGWISMYSLDGAKMYESKCLVNELSISPNPVLLEPPGLLEGLVYLVDLTGRIAVFNSQLELEQLGQSKVRSPESWMLLNENEVALAGYEGLDVVNLSLPMDLLNKYDVPVGWLTLVGESSLAVSGTNSVYNYSFLASPSSQNYHSDIVINSHSISDRNGTLFISFANGNTLAMDSSGAILWEFQRDGFTCDDMILNRYGDLVCVDDEGIVLIYSGSSD